MKAIQIPVLAAMAVILSASEARARTAATRNPVFGVESAKLEVTIGGALGLETGSALHLFAGSIPRADRFETELKEAVAEIFRASQIPFSKDAQHTLMLSFFGREIG